MDSGAGIFFGTYELEKSPIIFGGWTTGGQTKMTEKKLKYQ